MHTITFCCNSFVNIYKPHYLYSCPIMWTFLQCKYYSVSITTQIYRIMSPKSLLTQSQYILILRLLKTWVMNFTMEINNILFRMLTLLHQSTLQISLHKTPMVYKRHIHVVLCNTAIENIFLLGQFITFRIYSRVMKNSKVVGNWLY